MPPSISIKFFKASFHWASVGLPILLGKMHLYYLLVYLPQFCGSCAQLAGSSAVHTWPHAGTTAIVTRWPHSQSGALEGMAGGWHPLLLMWSFYVTWDSPCGGCIHTSVVNCHIFWMLGSIPMYGSNKAIISALFQYVVKMSHRTTPGGSKSLAWVWEARMGKNASSCPLLD